MDWSSEKSIRDHLTAKKVELAILRLLASRKSRIFYLQVETVETVETVDSGMADLNSISYLMDGSEGMLMSYALH